jgi:hypothetical protein
MNRSRRLAASALALLLALAVAACARHAEEKLAAAEGALEAARRAEAPAYAPEAYARAERALETAREELRVQAERSLFARDYDRALELVAQAKAAGREATTQAVWNRDDARLEAEGVVYGARQALASARRDAASFVAGGTSVGLSGADLERAEASLSAAERALDAGDYRSATSSAERAQSWARGAAPRTISSP